MELFIRHQNDCVTTRKFVWMQGVFVSNCRPIRPKKTAFGKWSECGQGQGGQIAPITSTPFRTDWSEKTCRTHPQSYRKNEVFELRHRCSCVGCKRHLIGLGVRQQHIYRAYVASEMWKILSIQRHLISIVALINPIRHSISCTFKETIYSIMKIILHQNIRMVSFL